MKSQISFRNSRNGNLAASLWPAESRALVIMVHGADGNRFAKGLFETIAVALQHERYNVLSFDFSGHGESDNDIFNLEKAVDDLHSAIECARFQGYRKIALFGHSFGALTCLKTASPFIETMVLLGAMTGPVQWKWEDFYTPEIVQEIKTKGYATTQVNDELRTVVQSDVHILDELAKIDQKTMLSAIHCPVLIIHGDADPFELEFIELSKKAIPLLPKESDLNVIEGASHSFVDKADQVITLTKKWYQKHFLIDK